MRIQAIASWPGSVLLYPARHIRWKIIAPYAVLTVALAIAGTYLVTRLVGSSLDERFTNQLAEASRVSSDSLARHERRHLEAVRSIGFTEGVGAAVANGESAPLRGLVEPLLANSALERVEIVSADGTRIWGAQIYDSTTATYAGLDDEPADRGSWTVVRNVLSGASDEQGDKFTEIAWTGTSYVLYTGGPIYLGDQLVGAVLVGTPLTSFVAAAKVESFADVTVYNANGYPMASTFPEYGGTGEADLTPGNGAIEAAGASLVREQHALYGRDFDLVYGALTIRGETVGYYSVALPSSFVLQAQSTTRWQMALLFTVAIVAALVAGYAISKNLTEPIFKLVAAANAVSLGDLSARSGVKGRDEIGSLGRAFDAMTERLQTQHLATVKALTSAIDARDPYTMGHSTRVGQLAVELGKKLGVSASTSQHLEIGGYLHDIGKIGVRDSVLLKPGMLTLEERQAIERHPRIGLDILEHVGLAPEVMEFVGGHHEKLNGKGYPRHLHGEELSIVPRIAAVADIYDALTTDRPYRAGMTPPHAMEILYRETQDGQLDADVVAAMEEIVELWEERRNNEPALRGFRIGDESEDEAGTGEEQARAA